MSNLRQSFSPSISPEAKVLILGSMPGERSLREQQYYAHPQNIFWDIIGNLFGAGRTMPYQKRLQTLIHNRVGLWDVACQCYRKGSLDADIRMASVVPNDFVSLFSSCPQIEAVFFNGHKAEQLFRKLVLKNLLKHLGGRSLRFERLPSTSPAHASLTRDQKKTQWRRALMARHFVYILQASDGRYYTGYTTDLDRRMQEHKNGKGSKFVRGFGFKKLLYHELHPTKSHALKREAEIKSWSRTKKQELIR